MLSNRVPQSSEENPLYSLVARLKSEGKDIIDLTVSNPVLTGLSPSSEILSECFKNSDFSSYNPNPKGRLSARAEIVKYYSNRGIHINPESILITSGTSEGFGMFLKAVCNPGDFIMLPSPGYPLYEVIAGLENISVETYDIRFTGEYWEIDFKSLESKLNDRTRAIVLVYPGNPISPYLDKEVWERLERISNKNGLYLVLDEVFYEYGNGLDLDSYLQNEHGRIVLLNGVSKMLCLPQIKISWLAIPGNHSSQNLIQALEYISDAYLSASTIFQSKLGLLFHQLPGVKDRVQERLRSNYHHLEKISHLHKSFRLYPYFGAWFAVFEIQLKKPVEDLSIELLQQKCLLVHPGYLYNFEQDSILAISLILEEPKFLKGLKLMEEFLQTNESDL